MYFNPYQQTVTNGLVNVRSEIEARSYPIAPGNSVTFKDETAPYVYTKTMGFSPLDQPVFEKYRLVKEGAEMPVNEPKAIEPDNDTLNEIKADMDEIKARLDLLEKPKRVKKEVTIDE